MKTTFLFGFLLVIGLFCYTKIQAVQQNTIFITEALPDATGTDTGKEYFEIFNSSSDIILKDWYITNTSQSGSSKKIVLPEIIIKNNSYFVIAEDLSILGVTNGISLGSGKLAFYNDFGKIQLFNSTANLIAELNYGDSKEGISWELDGPLCNQIAYSLSSTPGIKNSNYKESCFQTPISYPDSSLKINNIQFSLDNIAWTDTVSTFINTPIYFKANLSTPVAAEIIWKDASSNVLTNPHIFNTAYSGNIYALLSDQGNNIEAQSLSITVNNNISKNVLITEIYSSPESPDKEWIEIFNNDTLDINLSNYYLEEKISSGISNNKKKLKDQVIKPKEYYVLYEEELNISFNNSGDSIYLFDTNGNKINTFIYSDVPKSASVGRKYQNQLFTDETYITATPTPSKENQFLEGVTDLIPTFTLDEVPNLKSGTEFLATITINNFIDKYIFINDSTGKLKAKLTTSLYDDLANTKVQVKAKVVTSGGIKNLIINPDDITVLEYLNVDYPELQVLEDKFLGDQFSIKGIVKEVFSNRYKIEFNGNLLSVYTTNTSDINKGDIINLKGTLDYYRNNFRIIEIEHSLPEVLGESVDQPVSYTKSGSNLIPQSYQEDYSKIYLVTFGYACLVFILGSEIYRNRKPIKRYIRYLNQMYLSKFTYMFYRSF